MKTPRPSAACREGFSLLEVLLSISLALVLMTAIGLAVDQSWRLKAQGQTELQRQQISRAVLRIIERDLRSAMFVPPSQFADDDSSSSGSSTSASSSTSSSNSTAGAATISGAKNSSGGGTSATSKTGSSGTSAGSAASTGIAAAGSSSTTNTNSQQQTVLASRGIRGDQLTIEIDAARPQRELAFALPVNAAIPSSRTSDFRTVMYSMAGPGQAADPLGRGGLARKEGDRYAVASAETAGRDATGMFSAAVLAPEIIGLQFRYFDGMMWQPAWDSVSAGRLPRAVEVLIRFAPPDPKRSVWLNAAVNRSTETVRMVMVVPAADPIPEETQQ